MLGMGLDQLVNVLNRLESRAIRVSPHQCSRLRHRRSSCTLCADYCPARAITWGDSLQVDSGQCTGCGMCATVCPTGALEAQAPTNAQLLAQVQERVRAGTAVAFACTRYLEPMNQAGAAFIPIACLGRLDESILIGAVSLGAETVWLLDTECAACPYAATGSEPGREAHRLATQMVQTANELLKAFGLPARIFIGPELPPGLNATAVVPKTGHTLSRRAFFSMLTRRTTGVAAVAAAATVDSLFGSSQAALTIKKGELPAHVPAKRQLLLLALRRLSIPTTMNCMADRQLWVQFGFTEVCTGCQMCAFFCPTGALRKIQQDGQAGLAFRLSDCTNCRLCQDVCYKQAVTLSPAANLRAILDDAVDTFVMWDANTTPRHALGMDHQRRLVGH